jgi:transposase
MKNARYSPEVRVVFESRVEGRSLWSTIESVAAKVGCASQTVNEWVKQHQWDAGEREGPRAADEKRVVELEREVR